MTSIKISGFKQNNIIYVSLKVFFLFGMQGIYQLHDQWDKYPGVCRSLHVSSRNQIYQYDRLIFKIHAILFVKAKTKVNT